MHPFYTNETNLIDEIRLFIFISILKIQSNIENFFNQEYIQK